MKKRMSQYEDSINRYETYTTSGLPTQPLLGRVDAFPKPAPLSTRLICEMIGTCLFVFFGAGVATQHQPQFDVLPVSVAHALTAMWLIYVFGDVSGAHFNAGPIIVALIDRKLGLIEAIAYLSAQGIGTMIAGGLLCAIYGTNTNLGIPHLIDDTKDYQGFLLEFICTTILSFVINFTTSFNTQKEAAFPIGLTVLSCFLLAAGRDGSALNPWRWLGPAVFTNRYDSYCWIYIIGPIGGFIHGYIIFRLYRYIWQSSCWN